MAGINAYIKDFGSVPFCELPFNDADSFVLSSITYLPLYDVVPEEFEEYPKSVAWYGQEFYKKNGYKHIPAGLVLPKAISKRLVSMTSTRRYNGLKVTGCVHVFDKQTVTQFCAMTFILPDKTPVVVFQGTDDTFCGWCEDINLLAKGTVRGQELAAEYLEKVASLYTGRLIVSGHSKGGNLALYAATHCSEATRARIFRLYNNEGPGFSDYDVFSTEAYAQLLPRYRHFVPDSACIGMMLCHDDDYQVVKSNIPIGIAQHDVASWQLKGAVPDTIPALKKQGQLIDHLFINLVSEATQEQLDAISDVMWTCCDATDQSGLLPFAKHIPSSIVKIKKAWDGMDPTVKDSFRSCGKLLGDAFKKAIDQTNTVTCNCRLAEN